MTTHQGKPRTPDYDPRLNSAIINLLLKGIDGQYKKGSLLCSNADVSLYAKKMTRGYFPLYSDPCRRGIGIASILLALLGIVAILAAILSPLSLAITITVAVIAILVSFCTGTIFVRIPRSQHGYVLVELNCNKCNEGHTVLYDCITAQKRRRFGYYTNPKCAIYETSSVEQPYDFIESAFEEMRNGLDINPAGYDCNHWADEFYAKIA